MSVKVQNLERPLVEGLTCPTTVPTNDADHRIDLRGMHGGSFRVSTGVTSVAFYFAFKTSDTPDILNDVDQQPISFSVNAGEGYNLPVNESYGVPYLFIKASGSAGTFDVYIT